MAALFDAMIAKRRAEALQAQREALAELAAMRQALAQKLHRRSQAARRRGQALCPVLFCVAYAALSLYSCCACCVGM